MNISDENDPASDEESSIHTRTRKQKRTRKAKSAQSKQKIHSGKPFKTVGWWAAIDKWLTKLYADFGNDMDGALWKE